MSLPSTPEILHNWPIGRPNRRPQLDKSIDAWLPVAEKVLSNGYLKAGPATVKSLRIGLRNILRGRCQEAYRALEKKRKDEDDG